MTENEWSASEDPQPMLEFLSTSKSGTARKFRLFGCACLRRIWPLLDDQCRYAVDVAEMYADGLAELTELDNIHSALKRRVDSRHDYHISAVHCLTGQDSNWLLAKHTAGDAAEAQAAAQRKPGENRYLSNVRRSAEKREQVVLLRDIFGPEPAHFPVLNPSWITTTAAELAKEIYRDRSFELLGALADSLRAAGCDDERLLSHCGQALPHCKGCWSLDLVLGRA
jgi:hypothetical protein